MLLTVIFLCHLRAIWQHCENIQERHASLLLRIEAVLHISKLATQEKASEFYEMGVLIGDLNRYTVKYVLWKHCCNIYENSLILIRHLTHLLYSISDTGVLDMSDCKS